MNTKNTLKKPVTEDWHRADIVASLRKCGWSLRKLSLHNGYSCATTLNNALDRPWPKAEKIIATEIGVDPADIWPSRYQRNNNTDTNSIES